MCGGAGTRLWPASREGRPKQFLPLLGQRSTFQETLLRVAAPDLFTRPIVVTHFAYRFEVRDQLAEIGVAADIVLEPARRDSGLAILAGVGFARMREGAAPDALVLTLAADQMIADGPGFRKACADAREGARSGHIVTFGIKPDRPASDYGYIRPGEALAPGLLRIAAFVEKPDRERAARYIAEGYVWNSGNFLFRADVLEDEYRQHDPQSAEAVRAALAQAGSDLGFITLDPNAFARARATSIDYALMEKTTRAAVMPVDYDWSDIGSWRAVRDLSARDAAGNAARGAAAFDGARDCLVVSDKALVALVDVCDLVVVASEDAVLVARAENEARIKSLVAHLHDVAPQVTREHLRIHRPWGHYHALDRGARYQVKRIHVRPGGRISLQRHDQRAEHWIVVRGRAHVTIEGVEKDVQENESVYIPMGAVHRLENRTAEPLELIEVQTGAYLGEDDIVRFDCDYQRASSDPDGEIME